MKNYLRGSLLIKEKTYINGVFKIIKGTVSEKQNNHTRKIYQKNDYVLLEYIAFEYTFYDYYVEELTVGIWIKKEEILTNNFYFNLLSELNFKKSIQIELLSIKDPLICFSRYLYLTFVNKNVPCFYLDTSIKNLSIYLKIERRQLSEIIAFLTNKNIITRQNKLWIIHNEKKLLDYAYKKDI